MLAPGRARFRPGSCGRGRQRSRGRPPREALDQGPTWRGPAGRTLCVCLHPGRRPVPRWRWDPGESGMSNPVPPRGAPRWI